MNRVGTEGGTEGEGRRRRRRRRETRRVFFFSHFFVLQSIILFIRSSSLALELSNALNLSRAHARIAINRSSLSLARAEETGFPERVREKKMMAALLSLCTTSTSASSTSTAAAAALASALVSRARLFSASSSSSPSPPPPTPNPSPATPRRRSKASGSGKQQAPLPTKLMSGAARRSLGLYRSALRASRLQPTDEAREALRATARSLMEKNRGADSQTAEHLQRRGARQLELVRSGAAVLGTVRV